MRLSNYKSFAVIMSIVILISIFLFIPGNHRLGDDNVINHNLVFEGYTDDEFMSQEDISRSLKWNKNILFYLNSEFILFNVVVFADLYKARHAEFIKQLSFYYFSIFIVFYINKKDGKKDRYACSLS
jgi:hypothetical protein